MKEQSWTNEWKDVCLSSDLLNDTYAMTKMYLKIKAKSYELIGSEFYVYFCFDMLWQSISLVEFSAIIDVTFDPIQSYFYAISLLRGESSNEDVIFSRSYREWINIIN